MHGMQKWCWSEEERQHIYLGQRLAMTGKLCAPTNCASVDKRMEEIFSKFVGQAVQQTLYCSDPVCSQSGMEVPFRKNCTTSGTCTGTCGAIYSISRVNGRIVNFPLPDMLTNMLTQTNAGSIICNNIYDEHGELRPTPIVRHGTKYAPILARRCVINGKKHCTLGINIVSDGGQAFGPNQQAYLCIGQLPDLGEGYADCNFFPIAFTIYTSGKHVKPNLTLFYRQLQAHLMTLYNCPIKYRWQRPDKHWETIYFRFLFNIYIADGLERK